ncbi:MAG: hypothetical protein RR140_00510 [Clostridia bacterium]
MKKCLVTILAFMIMLTGLIFSACDKPGVINISIQNYLGKTETEINLDVSGSSHIYTVYVSGFSGSGEISLDFRQEIVQIKKMDYLGNGKTRVEFLPLLGGITKLRITTLQGGKSLELDVKVNDQISNIFLKSQSIFAIKGEETLLIPENLLNFEPAYIIDKRVSFSLCNQNGEELKFAGVNLEKNKLTTTNTTEFSNVWIKATSIANPSIFAVFKVDLLSKIILPIKPLPLTEIIPQTPPVHIEIVPDITDPLHPDIAQKPKINLIATDSHKNTKQLAFTLPVSIFPKNTTVKDIIIDAKINSKKGSIKDVCFLEKMITKQIGADFVFNFNIFSRNAGEAILEISVGYANFASYVVKQNYSVLVSQNPTGLIANDNFLALGKIIKNEEQIPVDIKYDNEFLLFHTIQTYPTKQNIKLEIAPNTKFVTPHTLMLDILARNKAGKNITLDANKTAFDYIGVSLAGSLFEAKNVKDDISKSRFDALAVWAKTTPPVMAEFDHFVMIFTCEYDIVKSEDGKIVSSKQLVGEIKLSAKKGVESFGVSKDYENNTITMEKGSKLDFNGLEATSGAYIGEIKIKAVNILSTQICTVSQKEFNKTTLEIFAKKDGLSCFTLTLPNGILTTLNIKVVSLLNYAELKFGAGSTKNALVMADDVTKNDAESVSKNKDYAILIRQVENSVKIDIKVVCNPLNIFSDLFNYEILISKENIAEIYYNFETNFLTVTPAFGENNFKSYKFKIKFKPKTIKDFKVTAGDKSFDINFDITTLKYSTHASINATRNLIYNYEDMGFKGQNESEPRYQSTLTAQLNLSNGGLIFPTTTMQNWNFGATLNTSQYLYKKEITKTVLGENGSEITCVDHLKIYNFVGSKKDFDVLSENEQNELLIGEFKLTTDGKGIFKWATTNNQNLGNINVFCCLPEKNILNAEDLINFEKGVFKSANLLSHNAVFKITFEKYVRITNIFLKNYTENIYLDSRSSHNKVVLYLDMQPKEATDGKSFDVTVEPQGLVSVEKDLNKMSLTIFYNNVVGSGKIYIIPTNNYTSNTTFTNALTLPVQVSDGLSIQNPLQITSPEEFLQINNPQALSKHYKIVGTIDISSNIGNFPFGTLTGSIVGEIGKSKIIGINLSNVINISDKFYCGLFANIAKNAVFKDIELYGTLNLTLTQNVNVGLLCGENNGLIHNVSVKLDSSTIKNGDNAVEINCGGVVGVNNGTISSMQQSLMNSTTIIEMLKSLNIVVKTKTITGNTGGIVGKNNGKIEVNRNGVKTVNNFGISAIVNIFSVTDNVGGLAGENGGIICVIDNVGKICVTDNSEKMLICGKVQNNTDNPKYTAGGVAGKTISDGTISNVESRVFVRGRNKIGGLCGQLEKNSIAKIEYCVVSYCDTGENGIEASFIIYYGSNFTSDCSIFGENVTAGNKSKSYLTRLPNEYYGDRIQVEIKNDIISVLNFCNDFVRVEENLIADTSPKLVFYYEAKERKTIQQNGTYLDNQALLNEKNTNQTISSLLGCTNVYAKSSNNQIIEILTNGKIFVNGVGNVTITLTSMFNSSVVKEVKLYSTYFVDNFKVFAQSNLQKPLVNGSRIIVQKNSPVSLFWNFVSSPVVSTGNTSIELVQNIDERLRLNFDFKDSQGNLSNIFETIFSGNMCVIKTKGETIGTANLSIIPQFKIGETVIQIWEQDLPKLNLYAYHRKGTSAILFDSSSATIMPSSSYDLVVTQLTDAVQDNITLSITRVEDGLQLTPDKNNVGQFLIDGNPVIYVGSKILSSTEGKNVYEYNIQLQQKKAGKFYLTFTSVNGLSKTFTIEFLSQKITGIYINTYSSLLGEFIPNEKIEPGESSNVMSIKINPDWAEYDYVEVVNAPQNVANNSNVLFTLGKDCEVGQNYIYFNKMEEGISVSGIKLYKNKTGEFILNYVASTTAILDSTTNINITAYAGGKKCFETITKSYKVVPIDGVIARIANKTAINGIVYLAKGMEYSLEVNAGIYTNQQVRFELKKEDNSEFKEGKIKKTENGWALTLDNNASDNVNLIAYGQIEISNKIYESKKSVQKLYITDFVLNNNALNLTNTEIRIQIGGGGHVVKDKMLEGLQLEYNTTIKEVATKVLNFKTELKNRGNWQLHTKQQDGTYTTIPLASHTNKYFTITEIKEELIITPTYLLDANENMFMFSVECSITFTKNKWQIEKTGANMQKATNGLEIFQKTELNNPIPINNVVQFMNMKDNMHYRLVCDLDLSTVEGKFTPILAKIASFDGNCHKIKLCSYSLENTANVGLFSEISKNSIIKNVILELPNIDISIIVTNSDETATVNAGLLAGVNNGIISNCEVVFQNFDASANRYLTIQIKAHSKKDEGGSILSEHNYVGGLIGANFGSISNSRVNVNIKSNSNLGGFVGINNGVIASSHVKNSSIENEISADIALTKVAGFAVVNRGKILTSFCSVDNQIKQIHAKIAKKEVFSRQDAAAFVYLNAKSIEDCYANVNVNTQGYATGFVFSCTAQSQIFRCNTTTIFGEKDNQISKYPFLKIIDGKFADCLFVENKNINSSNGTINNSTINGVKAILIEDFAKIETFEHYSISNKDDSASFVWFMPNLSNSNCFILHTDSTSEPLKFDMIRPELTATNIIAKTKKSLDGTQINNNGEIKYIYSTQGTGELAEGEKYNPYIISTVAELESTIMQVKTGSEFKKHIRILCDLDYGTTANNCSELYSTNMLGYIEGNGFEISNYIVSNATTLQNSGFFSQIGSKTIMATLMNITFSPKSINLPNVTSVGSVAGLVQNSRISNVSAVAKNYSKLLTTDFSTVLGCNVAGGLFGRVNGDFMLCNLVSQLSAKVINYTKSTDVFYDNINDRASNISYAGAVAGIISGHGIAKEIFVQEKVLAYAKIAGLYFGGVLGGATFKNVLHTIVEGSFVNAHQFGGVLVGELNGTMQNIKLTNIVPIQTDFFVTSPQNPFAVGGLVGLFTSGTINNCNSDLSIYSTQIGVVGGLVGIWQGGKLINSNFGGNITATIIAGGIVGKICMLTGANVPELNFGEVEKTGVAGEKVDELVLNNCNLTGIDQKIKVDNCMTYDLLNIDPTLSGNKTFASAGAIIGAYTFNNQNKCLTIKNLDLRILPSGLRVIINAKTIGVDFKTTMGIIIGSSTANISGVTPSTEQKTNVISNGEVSIINYGDITTATIKSGFVCGGKITVAGQTEKQQDIKTDNVTLPTEITFNGQIRLTKIINANIF